VACEGYFTTGHSCARIKREGDREKGKARGMERETVRETESSKCGTSKCRETEREKGKRKSE